MIVNHDDEVVAALFNGWAVYLSKRYVTQRNASVGCKRTQVGATKSSKWSWRDSWPTLGSLALDLGSDIGW